MNKYEGISFKCQGCRGEFYSLTDKFQPTPPMRGDYVELLPLYGVNGYNWYDFQKTEFTVGDNVCCVQCGEPLRVDYITQVAEAEIDRRDRERSREREAQESGDVGATPEINPGCCEKRAGRDAGAGQAGEESAPGSGGVLGDGADDRGIYASVEIEDNLSAEVLRMTAAGSTQVQIAETCGISVYRVRKFQDGELK